MCLKGSYPVGKVGNIKQNILVLIIEIIAESIYIFLNRSFFNYAPTFIPWKPMNILILKSEDLFLLL